MSDRRIFLKKSAVASALVASGSIPTVKPQSKIKKPVVISTWKHGIAANEAAWEVLSKKGRALDAVEKGVNVSELDPEVTGVGYGGFPDREGNVTLDACIMDEQGNCGSVGFLKEIKTPISVARKVMENTPHIMLTGTGAQEFALAQGFKKETLLTKKAEKAWKEWLKKSEYKPMMIDENNHDTIGMVALDMQGDISGACTTSGLAWKYHGRVGDSPIIGAGMYADNEAGAACATGKGEAVIKIAGSFLIVELMRNGKSPQEACELAMERIVHKQPDHKEFQVGFLALNKAGEIGAYSLKKGFQYALYRDDRNELIDANYHLKG